MHFSVPLTCRFAPELNFTTTPGWMLSVTPPFTAMVFFTQKTVPTTVPVGPHEELTETLVVICTVCASAKDAAPMIAANAIARAMSVERTGVGVGQAPAPSERIDAGRRMGGSLAHQQGG